MEVLPPLRADQRINLTVNATDIHVFARSYRVSIDLDNRLQPRTKAQHLDFEVGAHDLKLL